MTDGREPRKTSTVRAPQLLNRIRTALRGGWHNPITHYGAIFKGTFEIKGSRISGIVGHDGYLSNKPPTAVVVLRDGKEIALTDNLDIEGTRWRFVIDVGFEFTPDDVLKDRIAVFALDWRGNRSPLAIVGAMQLGYIKEAIGKPSKVELLIDFSRGGNSIVYVRDGWYAPEREHTWTKGTSSTLDLPLIEPGSRYTLEMLMWPFVVPDKIPDQSLAILVNDNLISKAFVQPGFNLIECDVPPDCATLSRATLRFDHPDAAKPCDHPGFKDDRVLALAFKTLKLRRQMPQPTTYLT